MFTSIIPNGTADVTAAEMLMCTGASALLGIIIALCYMYKSRYSRNFVCTLILLPVIVQAVIMLVNGNVGTGVAVAGAFSLVRFRSVPGTSREIGTLFLAMTVGIATGMGQLLFAAVVTVCVCVLMFILSAVNFGGQAEDIYDLKMTVPEDMEFEGAFDDIFEKYTAHFRLNSAKTTGMGSLYELKFEIIMKKDGSIKKMTDELRTRNGNLTINCARRVPSPQEEL